MDACNTIYKYSYSIIIPHFSSNGELKLLQRAIDSIPCRPDIQTIVVDNSVVPIDFTKLSKRDNLEVLFSSNSRGAGGARNEGIDCAEGRWFLFLDADDFFTKDAFKITDDYLNSVADVIFFKMTSCDCDTLAPGIRHSRFATIVEQYFENHDESALRYDFSSPCSKMISSDFVKCNNLRYDEIYSSNDVMFSLNLGINAKEISIDRREVYCATERDGSLTRELKLSNIECRFGVVIRKNNILLERGLRKHRESLYGYIKLSLKFGVIPAFILFCRALSSGNIFVGFKHYFTRFISSKH